MYNRTNQVGMRADRPMGEEYQLYGYKDQPSPLFNPKPNETNLMTETFE